MQQFQLGDDENYDQDGLYDYTKTNAADRRDMLRMGKPQEMRVNMMQSYREILPANANAMGGTAQLQSSNNVWVSVLHRT